MFLSQFLASDIGFSLYEKFFGPVVAFFEGLVNITVQTFNVLIHIPRYFGIFIQYIDQATQFTNNLSWLSWIPTPIIATFMCMVVFSIMCAIFGRIRS